MTVEIERKWLVPEGAPLADAQSSVDIRQGYLAINNEVEVRIRAAAATCLLTVKTGRGLRRVEVEVPISRDQFDALWPATKDARIEKTRHILPVADHLVEVDVYSGDLAGLVVAEVEFDSDETAASFEPPAWFGQEVTDADGWKNASLAVDGAPVSG